MAYVYTDHRRVNDKRNDRLSYTLYAHIKYTNRRVRYKVKWLSAHQTTQQVSITWANGKHN